METTWEVVKGPCLLVSATAVRADSIVQIEIHQSGDPLADCAAGPVGYRFITRVFGLARGRYQVRLVDATLGLPPAQVGRKAVDVAP